MKEFKVVTYDSIEKIDKKSFEAIEDPCSPFSEYEYFQALELSGCIAKHNNWIPRYVVLYHKDRLIGATPVFIKTDSYGEYIFDWEWAHAYHTAGIRYYPKAVVTAPFTPTTGKKILIHPDYDYTECAEMIIKATVDLCYSYDLSSIHYLFVSKQEQDLLSSKGFLPRITHQYHWHNRGYTTFDDFLADLKSSKRKQIRKERKAVYESGIEIELLKGDEIQKEHIDAIWNFYMETNSRKWGTAYLNKGFFELIHQNFLHRTILILAKKGNKYIGGSINFEKNKRLFGRYWGSIIHKEFLHFECCYYKPIEYAIEQGIQVFEAGAQGEHKFLRGFAAVPIYSSHYILNNHARTAINDYLNRERTYMKELIVSYNLQSPLKYLKREDYHKVTMEL